MGGAETEGEGVTHAVDSFFIGGAPTTTHTHTHARTGELTHAVLLQRFSDFVRVAACSYTETRACLIYPTTNSGMQNGSLVGILCTHSMHVFCTFGANLYAQSVLNKISALELSRKFIKSAWLVG